MTEKVKIEKIFAGLYKANNGFIITKLYGIWWAEYSVREREDFKTFREAKKFVTEKGFAKNEE